MIYNPVKQKSPNIKKKKKRNMLKKESEGKKLRNSQVVDKLPENCVTKLW